ncbi:MAG: hypothetical protein IH991_09460 [Planctomycetes bacterium]|nr:hypothetical protein [Planctomycetota bacterium]
MLQCGRYFLIMRNRRGRAIYRHISIGGYVAGTTVSVYRFLKFAPAGEVQETLDKLMP